MMHVTGTLLHKRLWGYLLIFALGMISFLPSQTVWESFFVCHQQFDLLNPDSACVDEQTASSEWDYEQLRQQLIQRVEHYAASGIVPHIALYFRDLQHGSRFAIRENENFEPASLLKVPLMMVILHEADRRPAFLDESLTYKEGDSYRFITGSLDNTLQDQASYTIRELLEKMIRYSDNSSATLLFHKVNEIGLQENSNAFADLGTMNLLQSGELDNTRLISLVNIFVALFNANYLSKHSSQFALELLTQTNFDSGIVGGVPKDLRVAHKYGMRVGSDIAENELHDCGIVYHAEKPYVLCILTSGADANAASAAIGDISRTVYEYVDGLRP